MNATFTEFCQFFVALAGVVESEVIFSPPQCIAGGKEVVLVGITKNGGAAVKYSVRLLSVVHLCVHLPFKVEGMNCVRSNLTV